MICSWFSDIIDLTIKKNKIWCLFVTVASGYYRFYKQKKEILYLLIAATLNYNFFKMKKKNSSSIYNKQISYILLTKNK